MLHFKSFTFYRTPPGAEPKRAFVVADVYEPIAAPEKACVRLIELNKPDAAVIEYALPLFTGLVERKELVPFDYIPIP